MEKIVPKKWGCEHWIKNNDKYCGKFLFVNKGFHSSIHCHIKKHETFMVLTGKILLYMDDNFHPRERILNEEDIVEIKPGVYHGFTGIKDLNVILEISTHHEDKDVVRECESGKKEIIYVDIDGFLCTDENGKYNKVKPIKEHIDFINKEYDKGEIIIIWTARGQTTGIDFTKLTEKQLKKWKVKYHDLLFDKPYFDILHDDKARETY